MILSDAERQLTEALKTARGQRFGSLLKQTYALLGPRLTNSAREIKQQTGKLTPTDVGGLALQFSLCLKHTFDFLEDDRVLPSGTYDRLKDRGLKAKEVFKAVAVRSQAIEDTEYWEGGKP
ncbi:MAG: hypothetical protein HC852_01665 [Acaryochloridaceae cyanobacterium RU_4_10]|nr:hypothetical protein [Acaryochloridaceae cyanobacterium RU_4_10]